MRRSNALGELAFQDLLSDANGYIVDDTMEIRVDIIVKDVSFSIFEKCDAPGADIKPLVHDNTFYVSKGVSTHTKHMYSTVCTYVQYLSVVSSVFRDMFAFTDADEGKRETEEIELKDLDASEFRIFLGAVYPTRYPVTG